MIINYVLGCWLAVGTAFYVWLLSSCRTPQARALAKQSGVPPEAVALLIIVVWPVVLVWGLVEWIRRAM